MKNNLLVITLLCTLLLLATNVLTLPTTSLVENSEHEGDNTTHDLYKRKKISDDNLKCCTKFLFIVVNPPCSDNSDQCIP
ncbi:unnamed protein product [Rhizophagus irregularis]|uniref:Uncharacterized protein n=1 Tax=Rhizophagus irregularis TaxID=588596 RepID=A0A2I1G5K6_9GLOM|nr:hypothetical protein RhiirA4_455617 [Rhizophagus irregularis]CAB4409153.1 unnamed protein product [Rhizophagus irregularis]CAB4409528.1 unnamed protein product [Rhizophagus irregularis]